MSSGGGVDQGVGDGAAHVARGVAQDVPDIGVLLYSCGEQGGVGRIGAGRPDDDCEWSVDVDIDQLADEVVGALAVVSEVVGAELSLGVPEGEVVALGAEPLEVVVWACSATCAKTPAKMAAIASVLSTTA